MTSDDLQLEDERMKGLSDESVTKIRRLGDKSKEKSTKKIKKKFNFEKLVEKHKVPVALALIGVILVGFGALFVKSSPNLSSSKVEVLENASEAQEDSLEIVVEIAGSVEKPGVYRFTQGARIDDVLVAAGGLSAEADRKWLEKYLNRASRLSDGQKIYIPSSEENLDINVLGKQSGVTSANNFGNNQTGSSVQGSGVAKLININTASQEELESLWGIGPVYAQNIIEHRPYSTVEELLTKKIIKQNVYERNKDLLTVY